MSHYRTDASDCLFCEAIWKRACRPSGRRAERRRGGSAGRRLDWPAGWEPVPAATWLGLSRATLYRPADPCWSVRPERPPWCPWRTSGRESVAWGSGAAAGLPERSAGPRKAGKTWIERPLCHLGIVHPERDRDWRARQLSELVVHRNFWMRIERDSQSTARRIRKIGVRACSGVAALTVPGFRVVAIGGLDWRKVHHPAPYDVLSHVTASLTR